MKTWRTYLNLGLYKQPREFVIQDVEIPLEKCEQFLEFFHQKIGINHFSCPHEHSNSLDVCVFELQVRVFPSFTLTLSYNFWLRNNCSLFTLMNCRGICMHLRAVRHWSLPFWSCMCALVCVCVCWLCVICECDVCFVSWLCIWFEWLCIWFELVMYLVWVDYVFGLSWYCFLTLINIGIKPVWMCPVRSYDRDHSKYVLYECKPNQIYINFGYCHHFGVSVYTILYV